MLTVRRAPWCRSIVGGLVVVVVAGLLMVLASPSAVAVLGARPPGGSYEALSPARIVNTRTGLGVAARGPTRRLVVSAAGRSGVPEAGVSAIAVNVTVTGGSVPGVVTAYPTDSPGPHTSNVKFLRRQTVSRMAVVPLNGAGQFTLDASAPAQLVVDVEGYFTSPDAAGTGGLFNPLGPARIMDSRSRSGPGAPGPGDVSVMQVTGLGGVPATGVSAVVINTTITGPTSAGYVTEYPTGSPLPATSTVNFSAGETLANRAIVPVGTGGMINVYNDAGVTPLAIDVSGYFTDDQASSTGGYYVPVPVSRVADTRFWQTSSPMSTRTLKTQKIAGETCVLSPARTLCGRVLVPPITAIPRPIATLINITAVPKGIGGYLTAFPSDSPIPASSDVSFTNTAAASNLTFVSLSSGGEVSVHNSGGFANVVEDVCGYFVLPAVSLSAATFGAQATQQQVTRPRPLNSSPAVTQPSATARPATPPSVPAPSVTAPSVTPPSVTPLSVAPPFIAPRSRSMRPDRHGSHDGHQSDD